MTCDLTSSAPPAMRDTTVDFRNSDHLRSDQSTFICWLVLLFTIIGLGAIEVSGREPDQLIDLWPQLAPGETTRELGEQLPPRPGENPPATRVRSITCPRLAIYQPPADQRSQAAVIILPGGGYKYIVVDKEGSEAAVWLNRLGVTALVLHYRTTTDDEAAIPAWQRPVQDLQRAVRWVRSETQNLAVSQNHVGVLGFSAGGQAAAVAATRFNHTCYQPQDKIDRLSARPDFLMLIYPWHLLDQDGRIRPEIQVQANAPPTFLVHAHDDRSSSLGSALLYVELKRQHVTTELHVYETGGHGYGLRPVSNSQVATWPDRAAEWMRPRSLILP